MRPLRRHHSLPSRVLACCLSSLTVGALTPPAWAGPAGERVVHGSASFQRDGSVTQIVAGDRSIIAYDSFDIGAGETVEFVQPSAKARVLNRVLGVDPTQIDGSLLANGRVYLVNANGIYLGDHAVVDAGAVFAAAGAISDQDFLARRDRFTSLSGRVVNLGSIRGDMVALLGSSVSNAGSIASRDGLIALVAGSEVVLVPLAGRVRVRVAPGAPAQPLPSLPGVENTGRIDAGDGAVQLAAGDLYSLAVRQGGTGSIRARDVAIEGTGSGLVEVGGRVDASSAAGTGGSVTILGERVALQGATVDASGALGGGSVLLGGGAHGGGGLRTADVTVISADSTVRADATASGAGGTVVAWSDGVTLAQGALSARGAGGGVGGFVETSGHLLEVSRTPDVGPGGTWLLDPIDVDIVAAGTGNTSFSTTALLNGTRFDPTNTPSQIGVDLITNALSGGASVVVTTNDPPGPPFGDAGNISLLTDLDYDGTGTNHSLTLQATHDIVLGGKIFDGTPGGDALSVALQAGGNVTVNAGASVTTQGGTFSSQGVSFTGNAAIDAGTGAVQLSHTGDVALNADVTGGSIDAVTTANLAVASGVALAGTSAVTLRAGTDGSGDLSFAAGGSQLRSAAIALSAGGRGAGGTGAITGLANVTLRGAPGGATSPTSLALEQDANLATAGLTFGASAPSSAAITSHEGDLTVDGDYDYDGSGAAALTLSAKHDLVFASDITDSSTGTVDTLTLVAHGGNDGTGNVSFNAGSHVHAGDLTLHAGTGTGTSQVSFANAALRGTGGSGAPARFTWIQDAAIADAVDPATVFGGAGAVPGTLTLESDQGTATVATAARVSGADLTITGQDVALAAGLSLASLTANATDASPTITLNGDVATTGAQDYQDAVTLGAATTQLTAGSANFASTVNGASALTVTAAGATTFGGAVGGTTNLTSLRTNGGGTTALDGGAVATTGAQDYQDAVTLGGAATQLTAGSASFASTLNGASVLTVTAAGTTTFGGAVGGTTSLTSLRTDGGGTTALDGGSVATTGAQDYQDAVTLGAATTQLTAGSANSASTVNGASALTVTAAGTTTFGGAVGGTTHLTSLTTDGGGTTVLGGAVTTTGGQTYSDAVQLGAPAVALASSGGGDVTLGGTVDSAPAQTNALAVNTAGTTRFAGAVGGTDALASLATDAGGTTVFAVASAGDDVRTTGNQTYGDLVFLEQDTGLDATTGGTIAFAANVGSSLGVRDLAVRAEQIRVGGNLGGALAPLHDISLDVIDTPANHSDFLELTAAGNQAIVATGQLSLNGDGRAATPVEATIFKRSGDLSLNGATVLFGPREKATVIGNLTISGGTISLSDLTALTLGVSATGTLFLQTRDPAPTATGVGPDAAPDAGMDLVANAIAIHAAAIALAPVDAGAPSVVRLGTVDASNALVNGVAPGNPFVPVAIFSNVAQPIAAADLVGTVTGAGANTVLDLKAEGPARGSQRPPPSPVFLLIAKPTGGMNAAAASEKPLRSSEVTAFLRCDPEDAACQEKAVGAARARSKEAHELRQSYAKLFGASTETSGKSPAETSKEALQRAVDAYRQSNRTEPTGTAFRQFCETTPELSAAVRVLDDLRGNLRLARAFGRSGEGLGDYKQQALGRMLPEGMTLEGLEAAVEAGETPSANP